MRAVVTGVAGFIGSTLAASLLAAGNEVVGVDAFTDYYDVRLKEANVADLLVHPAFRLLRGDLTTSPLDFIDGSVDVLFHQAAQPGVRDSWGKTFERYTQDNVHATQRVLEAAVEGGVSRVVYASSSSIYGRADRYPVREDALPMPDSPYGVTKLAGEHLCQLYARNHGLATVSLRYFTVYGPRQRPDMATSRLIAAARGGPAFPMFGDGSQVRDFTYVDDIVRANLLAGAADVEPGTVLNVAGGSATSLAELIAAVEDVVGAPVALERRPAVAGDVPRTGGDTSAIEAVLGWRPEIDLLEGIRRQASA